MSVKVADYFYQMHCCFLYHSKVSWKIKGFLIPQKISYRTNIPNDSSDTSTIYGF